MKLFLDTANLGGMDGHKLLMFGLIVCSTFPVARSI